MQRGLHNLQVSFGALSMPRAGEAFQQLCSAVVHNGGVDADCAVQGCSLRPKCTFMGCGPVFLPGMPIYLCPVLGF